MTQRLDRILIVDDEESIRELLACALASDEREIEVADGVDEALALIETSPFDLVFTDLRMPGRPGEELVEIIARDHPDTILVIMTGHPSFDSAVQALRYGVTEYLQKPFPDLGRVDKLTRELLRQREESRRSTTERKELHDKVRGLETERRLLFRRVNLVKRNLREQIRNLEKSREAHYLDLSRVMTIIDNIVDGIVFTDLESKVILINPSAGEQLGLQSFAALGKPLGQIDGHRELLKVLDANHHETVRGEARRETVEFWTPQSEKRIYSIYTTPVRRLDESLTGTLSILQDITLQKKTEELKNQFLSIVAHELRTPLTGIKSFSSILGRQVFGELNERQAELIDNVVLQSDRLGHEIDKIINLGRLESEDFIPEMEQLSVESLFRNIEAPFQLEVENKNLDLVVEIETEGLTVYADRRDVRRSIQALLENAIKFTPPGGKLRLDARRGDHGVVISMSDSGIGIDPRYHKVIYEKFMQIENPLTRRYGGSGLGLPFAAQIVNAHGSAIRLESTLDQGSKFSFELASGPAETENEPILAATGRPIPGTGRRDD